jgi:hypothetical protein
MDTPGLANRFPPTTSLLHTALEGLAVVESVNRFWALDRKRTGRYLFD